MNKNFGLLKGPIAKIEQLDDFENEYVYDIGVDDDTPYYFGNNILLHNSCYFSAADLLEDNKHDRDAIIELYDQIADIANESFPDFMAESFNTSPERGALIRGGRELIGSKSLFIKKKKYAILVFEKEGHRYDSNGAPGQLKAMGLDLKRADTPKFMQEFLEKLLIDLLTDVPKEDMFAAIRQFRIDFTTRPGWEKGTPKRVNGISGYQEAFNKSMNLKIDKQFTKGEKGKVNMPGHVRASINWNNMCDMMNDKYSMKIIDGGKVIVCKLKPNVHRMDSIAYPIDQFNLPQWFKELPFDHNLMEETIIDKKLDNLVGVLNWELYHTKKRDDDDLFVHDLMENKVATKKKEKKKPIRNDNRNDDDLFVF
jgi:hypothetical protein